ncbi:MAG TPA: cyclic nucleotide-binding domain-containing protein [Acidimicrobiia bacterium]|jgi:CRP-like cAMP-binding protein|nr:cyclic nucleotide-binding domain-containing protein [Acidimicrobiia bacterium]
MFVPITADDLARVPLFEGLSRDKLERVASHAIRISAYPGIHLARQGAPGFDFFIVLDGTAEVRKDGKTLATLKEGDVFGEMALLGGHKRNADVVATSPMTLLTMMVWDFRSLTEDYPIIGQRLEQLASSRTES